MLSDQFRPTSRYGIDWQAKAAELEEDNRQLRAAMGAAPDVEFIHRCKVVFGIPGGQSRLLAILMAGKARTFEGIWLAYCIPGADRPDIGTVKTQISYLRKALAPHEIYIETIFGIGHGISESSLSRLRGLLGVEGAAAQ